MTNSENFESEYRLRAWFVFGAALLILLVRFFGHGLLHSMNHPLFLFRENEIVYKLFLGSGVPQFLTGSVYVAWAFDFLLLLVPVLFVLSRQRWLATAFTALLLVYFFTYNLVTGHHYHGLIGTIIISIPFWTKDENRFYLLWQGARYYLLYIFASAALWKVLRGTAFYEDQMSNILKAQQLDLLLQRPDTMQAHLIQYLIANPRLAHWVLGVNVLVQLSFLVGFFTRRFDWILLGLMVVFCLTNYFVMSIVSAELLILGLTLVDWEELGLT